MSYKLTKEADNDLIEIYIYGFKQFGELQAEDYFSDLESCFQLLSETPHICRERKEFNPNVRIHHHGSHLVIYIIQTDHILIVRILHDSMDILRHLKKSE